MHSFIQNNRIMAGCFVLFSIFFAAAAYAVMDPSLEIDPQLLDGFKAPARPVPKVEKRVAKERVSVTRGLRKLRSAHRHDGMGRSPAARRMKTDLGRFQAAALPAVPAQSLILDSPGAPSERLAALQLSEFWNKMMPSAGVAQKPISFQSPAFSLNLDPVRYPVYAAMDGARIVVDQDATIPALVRSLIAEKDPSVRIIGGSPVNSRNFLAAMLGAAGFYSVEENFVMEFGTDPKLKVYSDFKVEKSPESLIRQDVVLVGSAAVSFPQPLVSFLEKQGFTALAPFASPGPSLSRPPSRLLRQITAGNRAGMVDAILASLSVPFRNDFPIDVFGADNNGIRLSVKADRYFERDGQRCVVTGFDGDPVTYTLFRILETKGYQVVILEGKDDFRRVSEKILASLRLPVDYAQHEMRAANGSSYSLNISGFRLEGAAVPGGSLFLTDLRLDPIIRDLLLENGFDLQVK
jgi:hypothetical protein